MSVTQLNSTHVSQCWSKFSQDQPSLSFYTGTWLEIKQAAFDHNIACYAARLGVSVNIAVVIKSNGYGHGLEQMALLCQNNPDVVWLCTSTLSEAVRIRVLGVTKPLLVLSHLDVDPQLAHEHTIDVAVHDVQSAQALSAAVTGTVQVHIKIDTGLSRFGLPVDDAVNSVMASMVLPHLVVRGVYTHFAVSGEVTGSYIEEQHTQFNAVIDGLERCGVHIPLYHAAKSVVAARVPETRHSLVRLGAGAYGLCAQEADLPLRQVLTWKARIMHVRTVCAGAYIGYNRTYQATSTMRVAVVPLGYYEGYPLSLSNKGQVFMVRTQQFAPVVGRVCMNQLMIDVSHITGTVAVGDEVELLGDRDGIRIIDLARDCASNNERELVARLNPLLTRVVVP